jgi:hypothetical protein
LVAKTGTHARHTGGYDSYSIGWRDGCNTYTGIIGEGLLRNYDYAMDNNRALKDKDYYLGFRVGQDYCTYYLDKEPF